MQPPVERLLEKRLASRVVWKPKLGLLSLFTMACTLQEWAEPNPKLTGEFGALP